MNRRKDKKILRNSVFLKDKTKVDNSEIKTKRIVF